MSQAPSSEGAKNEEIDTPSISSLISTLIIEEVEKGKNDNDEDKSKDNLIKLLSLLATLDDENSLDSAETSPLNPLPKIPSNRAPQQFAHYQTSPPNFQPT